MTDYKKLHAIQVEATPGFSLLRLIRRVFGQKRKEPQHDEFQSLVLRSLSSLSLKVENMATSAQIEALKTVVSQFIADANEKFASLKAEIEALKASQASLSEEDAAALLELVNQVSAADSLLKPEPVPVEPPVEESLAA